MKETNNRAFGTFGESIAREYMVKKGYTYVQSNYYAPHGEIDVIVKDGKHIVFCEVKTRLNTEGSLRYGRPASAVGGAKRSALVLAANAYLLENPGNLSPRIDVIEVYVTQIDAQGETWYRIDKTVHFENAVTTTSSLKYKRRDWKV